MDIEKLIKSWESENIEYLYNNLDLREKMSKNNKEKIKWFYIDEIAWKYLELI